MLLRVHLLEEQLRETEMRAADLLAEEQRRSRDIIVCTVVLCFIRSSKVYGPV